MVSMTNGWQGLGVVRKPVHIVKERYRYVYYTCPECGHEGETKDWIDEDEIHDIFNNSNMSILPLCNTLIERNNIEDILYAIKDSMEKSPYFKHKVMNIIKDWK